MACRAAGHAEQASAQRPPQPCLAARAEKPAEVQDGVGGGEAALPGRVGTQRLEDPSHSLRCRARAFVQDPHFGGAVKRLENILRDQRVLDICCGAGVLSCICASMGAASVEGVAASQEAFDLANSIVKANSLSDRVTITRRTDAGTDDANSAADVALAGEFLMDLRYGNRLTELVAARRRLRRGCRMLPSACTLWVCAADYSAEAKFTADGEDWRRRQGLLNLDCTPLEADALPQVPARGPAADEVLPALLEAVPPDRVASMAAKKVLGFAVASADVADVFPKRATFGLELRRDRCATSIVLYLDALLTQPTDGRLHPVSVSAAPRACDRGRNASGRQLLLHLPAPGPELRPLVLPGSDYAKLEGTLSMTLPEAGGGLRLRVSLTAQARTPGNNVAASATFELPA